MNISHPNYGSNYRLMRAAVRLGEFTVSELGNLTSAGENTIYSFIKEDLEGDNSRYLKSSSLAGGKPAYLMKRTSDLALRFETDRQLAPALAVSGQAVMEEVMDLDLVPALPYFEAAPQMAAFSPAVDVFENDKKLFLMAELPGVVEKDLHVQVVDNVLRITGRRTIQQNAGRLRRIERSYGSFARAFALPNTIDPKSVHSVYENGVLRVTLNHWAEGHVQAWHVASHDQGERRAAGQAATGVDESKADAPKVASRALKATAG
jgi:HSP20 family molecular chaperone IbpA